MYIYLDKDNNILSKRKDGKKINIGVEYTMIKVEDTEENKKANKCVVKKSKGKEKHVFSFEEEIIEEELNDDTEY